MAAATATALLGGGLAAFQAFQGVSDSNKAENALNRYKRQDLENNNPYKGLQISTVGSDLMREENQRTSANTVDALRNMGTRGASMAQGVVAANNVASKEGRTYLDGQVKERDYAIAGDDVNTRNMMEQRENADLAGLGNAMQVGDQNAWSGFRGIANAGFYAANNMDWNVRKPIEDMDPLAPKGLIPSQPQSPSATLPDWSKIYKNSF